MIQKEIKEKLDISELVIKNKINYTLFAMKDLKESDRQGESFVFKYSTSQLHKTDFLINPTFYKTIHNPFIMPEVHVSE